jgi:hypothetical protein
MCPRAFWIALLAAAACWLVGARGCGGVAVQISAPADETLIDEPLLSAAASIGSAHLLSSIEVRVDGVDLVDALGLVPPFENESGFVVIGSDVWTVTGFGIQPSAGGPRLVELELGGVPLGPHALAVSAMRSGGIVVTANADFERVAGFTLEAEVLDVGGRAKGPEGSPTLLFGASLGQPLAGSAGLSGGGALRQGFVETAQARVAGAGP